MVASAFFAFKGENIMTRLFAMAACAAALSLAAPLGLDAPATAQAKKAELKQCRAKASSGKVVTWKCKSDQPCCMNSVTGQGVCGSPIIGYL